VTFPCEGARDAASELALSAAFATERWREVTRLYRHDDYRPISAGHARRAGAWPIAKSITAAVSSVAQTGDILIGRLHGLSLTDRKVQISHR
jgi:hypothetical protein